MKICTIISILSITLFISGYDCCWSKSSSNKTPKTTTTTKPFPVEEDIIAASDAKRTRGKPPSGVSRHQGRSNVQTSELKRISEDLYRLEKKNRNVAAPPVDLQSVTTSQETNDAASRPLFSKPLVLSNSASTSSLLHDLLDNYEPNPNNPEVTTNEERKEIKRFLDAVANSPVMKKLEEFLKSKNLITKSIRSELEQLWFTPYSRGRNVQGSSGFEHVFLGETKAREISGFHNWIFFVKQEKLNKLDYKGYLKYVEIDPQIKLVKMRFDWLNRPKSFGSMFIGTTPELEMALYTLCFYTRLGKNCSLKMNNEKVNVKVYDYKSEKKIGSAFPQIF